MTCDSTRDSEPMTRDLTRDSDLVTRLDSGESWSSHLNHTNFGHRTIPYTRRRKSKNFGLISGQKLKGSTCMRTLDYLQCNYFHQTNVCVRVAYRSMINLKISNKTAQWVGRKTAQRVTRSIFFYRISERIFSAVRRLSLVKGLTYSREIWQASSDLQSGGIHQISWRSRHRFYVIFTHP